jgi:hypothetical protein
MASLLDVFNASARLASQGLDMYSREKKYHLDTELYKQAQDLELLQNRLAEDLTRVDKTGQMPFLNKPDEYRRYVEKSLAEWTKNAVRAGNGSRYYTDQLNQIALQGQTAMGKKLYAAEKLAERQRFFVDVQRNLQAEYNKPYSEGALSNALGIGDYAINSNSYNPVEAEELKSGIVNTFWSKAGTFKDNGRYTTGDAMNAVVGVLADYERVLREEHNIDPDHYIENKQRKIEEARQGAALQVQERKYTTLDIEDKEYRQMLRDWLEHAPGSEGLYPLIVERFLKGRAEVKAGTEGNLQSEYADNKKPAMKSMFPWDERLGAEPGKETVESGDIQNLLRMGVDAIFKGDPVMDAMTLADLDEGSVDFVYNALTPAQKKYADSKGGKEWLYREYYNAGFRTIQNFIDENAKTNSGAVWATDKVSGLLSDDLNKEQRRTISDFMIDVAQNVTYENSVQTEKYLKDKAQKTFELVKAEHLSGFGNPSFTDVKSLAKSAVSIQENPEAVYSDVSGNIRFLNDSQQKDIEQYQKEEQAAIATAYKYPAERLVHTYESEEGQKRDVTGKGEYAVLDEKGNWTNLRLRFTGEKTGLNSYEGHFQYRYLDDEGNGEWQDHTPGKNESALLNQAQTRVETSHEVQRISEAGTANGNFRLTYGSREYDARDWNELKTYEREGIIQDILKRGLNPGIPESEWKKLSGFTDKREAILDFFRGK